ncbi:MAG: hypothetical protein J1G38_04980 [Clostridiales bacterium]|nr:hypothetical protein [Clostridiales bacterium]
MQLGWIDFSKNERDKVLGVLESLTESGTLDELGIAPIRDGFADLFFPGTSTLHRHAKYFLIVPYACMDLERSELPNPNVAYKRLYEIERASAAILHKANPQELGIIGVDYINRREWVKRPPSTLYWAGLRRYGIFKGAHSLSEYLKAMCALKSDKDTLKKLGSRNDTEDCDDKDAGAMQTVRFFPDLRTYQPNWKEKLTVRLTKKEAEYLKDKIKRAAPDSLLVHLLNSKKDDILKCDSFEALSELVDDKKLKADCDMAIAFSNFLYVLRVVYNIVISQGENESANKIISELQHDLKRYADIDIDAIFLRLDIFNRGLKSFLDESKREMAAGNIDALKTIVAKRERSIKQGRAKTLNPLPEYADKWIGGKQLDYRFTQAKQLIKDIFDGEASDV